MRHLVYTGLLLALLRPAAASEPPTHPTATTSPPTSAAGAAASPAAAVSESYRPVRASLVIGQEVVAESGGRVGRLADIVVDTATGRVLTAVLEVDPGWLSGERLVPVPTTSLLKVEGVDGLVGNIDRRELLQGARDRPAWMNEIFREPGWSGIDQAWTLQRLAGQSVRLASNLLGKPVESPRGDRPAQLEELVVDLAAGRVHYAVLLVPSSRASDGKRVVLPLSAIGSAGATGPLVIDAHTGSLSSRPPFNVENYRDLDDPRLLREIQGRLSANAGRR